MIPRLIQRCFPTTFKRVQLWWIPRFEKLIELYVNRVCRTIFIPVDKVWRPVWLNSVTHSFDPDGLHFYLLCRESPFPPEMAGSKMQRVHRLAWDRVEREDGRWVYRKYKEPAL
jgi:hypothetical protein